LAGVGEFDVITLLSGTAVFNVGDEHVGKSIQEAVRAAGTSDRNGSAVHVHLTVSDLVEPAPGEDVVASSKVLRNREVVLVRDLGIGAATGQVSDLVLSRAATLDGLDDLPDRVLGRVQVGGDRDLARATAVDSGTLEGELLSAALLIDVLSLTATLNGTLAREVGAISLQRAAVWAAQRDRVGHDDVSRGHRGQAHHGESLGEHFE
jgi:hypothetical protein